VLNREIPTKELVMMQLGIDPGATCSRICRALNVLYWPRKFFSASVSAALYHLTKDERIIRKSGIGKLGGYGYFLTDENISTTMYNK
jgi:hypothetical protein